MNIQDLFTAERVDHPGRKTGGPQQHMTVKAKIKYSTGPDKDRGKAEHLFPFFPNPVGCAGLRVVRDESGRRIGYSAPSYK